MTIDDKIRLLNHITLLFVVVLMVLASVYAMLFVPGNHETAADALHDAFLAIIAYIISGRNQQNKS